MGLQVLPGSGAARLLQRPHGLAPAETVEDAMDPLVLLATRTDAVADHAPAHRDAQFVARTLTAGIQDVSNAMVEDVGLNDVLRMVLETMFRAMAFERIVFCMRDPRTNTLTGRFGLGQGVAQRAQQSAGIGAVATKAFGHMGRCLYRGCDQDGFGVRVVPGLTVA